MLRMRKIACHLSTVQRTIRTRYPSSIRLFSSSSSSPPPSYTSAASDSTEKLVIEYALKQVPEYGWTNDAIAAGVLEAKLPPTMAGMVSPETLVAHVMESGNARLQSELQHMKAAWSKEDASVISIRSRLVTCLKTRLEYNCPHVANQRWHQAMALGAMPPNNVAVTAKQLNDLVAIVSDAILAGTSHAPLGPLERTAIGAVYAATELFLLTDKSENYSDTWDFLQERVGELEILASSNILSSPLSAVNGDTAVAMSAVATSLGGAVLSLLQPRAMQFANSMFASTIQNAAPGTRPSDYDASPNTDDLPPFPNDKK